MGNNVNTKNKVGIKDLKKFVIFIIFSIIVIFIIVFVTLLCNKKQEINDNTNISELNIKKYSSEIKENYELEGKKDKFIEDYYYVQNGVGMYILNNSTLEDNSFESLKEKINKILSKKDWSELEMEVPTSWNGKWSVNEKGNVKFKFASKDIEPSWLEDENIKSLVELN